jgi:hypothetical protein
MSTILLFTCDIFCDKEEDHFYVIGFALGENKTLPKDFFSAILLIYPHFEYSYIGLSSLKSM